MNHNVCNGFLEALGLLNSGVNHGCEYTLEFLPKAASLDDALALYYASMSTSRVPAQPAAAWDIQTESLPTAWTGELEAILHRWFFAQEFSPSADCAADVVARFLKRLRETVGDSSAHRVQVSPPMWYECVWEDYAFDGTIDRWLLHLGFSD